MEFDYCMNCGAAILSSDRQGDLEKIKNFAEDGRKIADLLKIYPNGFSVAPDGTISRIVMATPHIRALELSYPSAPFKGGYLVVEMIDAK